MDQWPALNYLHALSTVWKVRVIVVSKFTLFLSFLQLLHWNASVSESQGFWMVGWVYKTSSHPRHESLEATLLCCRSQMHMQRGLSVSASLLFILEGTGTQRQLFIMKSFFPLLFSLLLVSHGSSAVITGVSASKRGRYLMGKWNAFNTKRSFPYVWCIPLNISLDINDKYFISMLGFVWTIYTLYPWRSWKKIWCDVIIEYVLQLKFQVYCSPD